MLPPSESSCGSRIDFTRTRAFGQVCHNTNDLSECQASVAAPMDTFEDAVFRTHSEVSPAQPRGEGVWSPFRAGPDSVALLLALLELRSRLDLTIEAGHVNHLLRGTESDEDEEFVRGLCSRAGIPLHVSRIETRNRAAEGRHNLEEYARTVRYGFLLSVAAELSATVATGHTLNDLSETFLLKLFRGAGVSGLSGVYAKRRNELGNGVTVDVVRPLLDSSRNEILEYLERRKQSYRQDSSNQDTSFDRNMIRHQLIPVLESRLNPGISRTLGRTALLFRDLEDFLSPIVDDAYNRCRSLPSATVSLWVPELLSQSPVRAKGDCPSCAQGLPGRPERRFVIDMLKTS